MAENTEGFREKWRRRLRAATDRVVDSVRSGPKIDKSSIKLSPSANSSSTTLVNRPEKPLPENPLENPREAPKTPPEVQRQRDEAYAALDGPKDLPRIEPSHASWADNTDATLRGITGDVSPARGAASNQEPEPKSKSRWSATTVGSTASTESTRSTIEVSPGHAPVVQDVEKQPRLLHGADPTAAHSRAASFVDSEPPLSPSSTAVDSRASTVSSVQEITGDDGHARTFYHSGSSVGAESVSGEIVIGYKPEAVEGGRASTVSLRASIASSVGSVEIAEAKDVTPVRTGSAERLKMVNIRKREGRAPRGR